MSDHADAIARLVESRLAADSPTVARRLLWPQLRWVASSPGDDALARRLGVLALVESCRDEYLAMLDADDGLAALAVDWRDVVARAAAHRDAAPRSCPRCGARLRRDHPERCGRCGLAQPALRRRSGSS